MSLFPDACREYAEEYSPAPERGGDAPLLEIHVAGDPAPKGSTRSFRHKHTGRIITLGDSDKLQGWENRIYAAAHAAWGGRPLLPGAVRMELEFTLRRPKGHYGARGLKPSAPRWPAKKPDIDKLARAILDALTGVVWLDDQQVTRLVAAKIYGDDPGVRVVVR